MTSPAMTGSGCRRTMSTAAASRDRADASGGAQACSHARAAGSSRPTGSRSTPTLVAMRGNSAGRRDDRAAHVTGKAQPGRCRPVRVGPHLVPVTVQLQPQPGPGTQIHQGHRVGGSAADRRDAQGDLGASGHLVHLVPAAAADLDDVRPGAQHKTPGTPGRTPRRTAAGTRQVRGSSWPAGPAGHAAPKRQRPRWPAARAAGQAGARPAAPRSSSSAAIASNSAAVRRHELGAPGGDHPPATSSAWARTSSAPDKMAPAGSAHPHHLPRIYRPCLVAQEKLRRIPGLTEDASPEAPWACTTRHAWHQNSRR